MSMFKKATKEKSKLRLAIFGPSGAGKTFTALRVATGMGGNIAVIDTERGSASKYADRFEFDVCDLDDKTIAGYVSVISEACKAGYKTLIIDSLSHSWQELLEQIDKLAKTKYKGNTWSAWSEGTPEQRKLVNALLGCDCHIIATMRSKTEWTTESGNNGKSRPVRVGLAPEQGKGIEYEFDMLMEISPDHVANIIKDRTGKYQDRLLEKPGEEFGKSLIDWLSEGAAPAPKPATKKQSKPEQPDFSWMAGFIKTMGDLKSKVGEGVYKAILAAHGFEKSDDVKVKPKADAIYDKAAWFADHQPELQQLERLFAPHGDEGQALVTEILTTMGMFDFDSFAWEKSLPDIQAQLAKLKELVNEKLEILKTLEETNV